ncbi:MAG: glycosyltransferase family 39 protein [bacterium]
MVEAPDLRTPGSERTGAFGLPAISVSRERWADAGSLAAVVAVALMINTWRLGDTGNGNTYYAAAVRSMAGSWHNFFFASFDPGGFISVDKPPVFLWFGALSVRIFGYSSWAILLPSAIAGAASVALLWLIVRKYIGLLAATIAAVALALSPISVAVDRLNLPEPFLILALIGAAGAVLQSIESKRWWAWVALAGALVGIAFNIKMLAAWIPGPAFALALLVAVPRIDRKSLIRAGSQLAILGVSTLVVSASWMLIVDAIPSESRPYVGGSTDNTVQNLIVDYNGVGRVDGNENSRPGGGGAPPITTNRSTGGTFPNNIGPFNTNPLNPPTGGTFNGRGGIIAGTPGLWRMFDDANGPQIAWLLPLALLLAPLALWRWRSSPVLRAVVVLFASWVLLFGGVFSYAQGIYHSYYTAALMPGIAVLAGLGIVATIDLAKRDARWMLAFLPAAWATAMVQLHQADSVENFYNAVPMFAVAVVAIAGLAAAGFALARKTRFLAPSLMVAVGALMVTPAVWSTYEARNPSLNTTLPQAGPREGAAGRSFGSEAFDGGVVSLAAWLEAHQQPGARWDLAVTSAMNASTLIADYDLSVMAIGGFSGSDPSITVDQFADYVAAGEIRYVLVSQGGPGGGPVNLNPGNINPVGRQNTFPNTGTRPGQPGANNRGPNVAPGQPGTTGRPGQQQQQQPPAQPATTTEQKGANAIMSAVRSVCTPVTGSDAPAANAGSLYDCSGAADKLRALN